MKMYITFLLVGLINSIPVSLLLGVFGMLNIRQATFHSFSTNSFLNILAKNVGFCTVIYLLAYFSRRLQYLTLFMTGFINGLVISFLGIQGYLVAVPHGIPEILSTAIFAEEGRVFFEEGLFRTRRVALALVLLILAAYIESNMSSLLATFITGL